MTFRHIKDVLQDVMAEAELKAARATKSRNNLKRGGLTPGVDISPPIAQAAGGETASNGMGKGPSPKARPVNREVVKQQRGETALQTLPRIGRCERMANSPPMNATSPVAAMRSHLLTEWLRHATGPR
jgi:hypothetical protein